MNLFDFGFDIYVGGQRPPLTSASASSSIDGSNNVVVIGKTAFNLSSGAWGFEYSAPNSTTLIDSTEVAGQPSSQSITVALVDLGNFSSGDKINVQPYYTLQGPGIAPPSGRFSVGLKKELTVP